MKFDCFKNNSIQMKKQKVNEDFSHIILHTSQSRNYLYSALFLTKKLYC